MSGLTKTKPPSSAHALAGGRERTNRGRSFPRWPDVPLVGRGIGAALFAIAPICAAVEPARPSFDDARSRPNIVWLTVEDMSPWLRCYGDATASTPALDRFADEAVRHTNAFASAPVCSVARSALITGMYPSRIGALHHRVTGPGRAVIERHPNQAVRGAYQGVPPSFVKCFPETLRAAGYYCTNNSKEDYQFCAPVTVWDDSSPLAHWRKRPEGAPFFAVFNYTGTHESQAFPTAGLGDEAVRVSDVSVPPLYPDTPRVRDALARTYTNIVEMDGWVARHLRDLENAGLGDETVVFFFSDHGVGLPRGKRSPYDLGLRVPLLIRWPSRARAGTVDARVVSFVDFAPTVLSIAGVEPDRRLDGVPFAGPHARTASGYAFASADRFDGVYDGARSVSDGRFRYVRNTVTARPYLLRNVYRDQLSMMQDLYELQTRDSVSPGHWQLAATTRATEELYDSHNDAWEVVNVVAEERHAEKLEELRSALDGWLAALGGDPGAIPESELVREHLWPPEGVQPRTDPPRGRYQDERLVIQCDTAGASIGYRLSPDDPWRVYTDPLVFDPDARVEAIAHRIGWKPSKPTILVGRGG